MAKRRKSGGSGYRTPPQSTRFAPGKSGNPKGRPKGSKNFDTALATELRRRITITENGQQRKATKQTAIIKQLTNKAAGGDLKAAQTIIKVSQPGDESATHDPFAVFDTAEDRLVIAELVKRIRSMDDTSAIETPIKSQRFSKSPK